MVFPGPVRAGETVFVETTSATTGWALYFANGTAALSDNSPAPNSENVLTIQTAGLSPGLYRLRIEGAHAEPVWAKLVIVR
jgi:acyl dehydratase